MVINTNIAAQTAAGNLSSSSSSLNKALAELSSGSKIVDASDDPAGLAVSTFFVGQMERTTAATNNVGDAVSFSQTQDGFLQGIGNALDQMSALAVQAQDVTKSSADRADYNQEFQALAAYISNASSQTFNGISLFSGNPLDVISDPEGGTFQMTGINANYLGATTTTTTTTTTTPIGDAATTTLGSLSPNLGDGTLHVGLHPGDVLYTPSFTSSNTIQDFVNYFNNDTNGLTAASYDASTGLLTLTVNPSTQGGSAIFDDSFEGQGQLLEDLGFATTEGMLYNSSTTTPLVATTTLTQSGPGRTTTTTTTTTNPAPSLDLNTSQDAQTALTAVKSALTQLATDRGTVGANIARLNFTSNQLISLQNNLGAANSAITDVDVARESTEYAHENILVEFGTAMLSQANNSPQSVLRLLS